MFPCSGFGFGYWWIFPIIMVVVGMTVLCIFMMRGHMGSMMCGPGSRGINTHSEETAGSALDILNKRHAGGAVGKR